MRGKTRAALACAVTIVAVGPVMLATGQATARVSGRAAVLAGQGKPTHSTPTHNAPPPPPPGPPTSQTPPRPAANCPPQAGPAHLPGEPWAQQALQFSSVWGLTRGHGVTVAVVDSGVDYTPQLAGRVTVADMTNSGFRDCVGHGTAVASIIAASDHRARGVPFYGVAPAARILSIKVNTGDNGYASLLAQGIIYAADHHAGVINVSICTDVDLPSLRRAVAYAQHHNAVVVAAAGNDGQSTYCSGGPFYPASYPGVVSVAAVGRTGMVTGYSGGRGTPISVAAPGVDVASAWPAGFSPANNGTSFAAAFVSGEAALIRSAFPGMTAAQVVSRIESTADGAIGLHSGAGIINPVQAVTAVVPAQTTPPPAARQPVSIPVPPRANSFTRTVAVSVAAGGVAAALLVVAIAVVLPRGRRRGWRPGRVDLKAIGAAPPGPGSDWSEEEVAPRRRGIHARGAHAASDVAARPTAPGRTP